MAINIGILKKIQIDKIISRAALHRCEMKLNKEKIRN